MGWFSQPPVKYRRRKAISIKTTSGTTTIDVQVTIPPEWDDFWNAIDSSGEQLRIVGADDRTVLAYAIDDGSGGAFDKTNRLGRIQIDGMTVPDATAMAAAWLYFDPSATVADGAVAVTIASPVTGYIELGIPGQFRLAHQPQAARARKPRTIFQKASAEQAFIWVRYDLAISRGSGPSNGSRIYEDPLSASISVVNDSGVDQTSMYDLLLVRWVFIQRTGQLWLRVLVKGGTTAENYTAVITARFVLPGDSAATQTLETRVGIAVRDALES